MARLQPESRRPSDRLSRWLLRYARASDFVRTGLPTVAGLLLAIPGLLSSVSPRVRILCISGAGAAALVVAAGFTLSPATARRWAVRRHMRTLDPVALRALLARAASRDQSLLETYVARLPEWRDEPDAVNLFRQMLVRQSLQK
jgi:hypothetical protein